MIVTAKDGDKNMLRVDVWSELRQLDGYIQNMTVLFDDEYFTYKQICAKWLTDCFQNDILNLDYIMEDVSIIIKKNSSILLKKKKTVCRFKACHIEDL